MEEKEKEVEITNGKGTIGAEAPETPKTRRLREAIKARYVDASPETDEQWYDLEDRYADEVESDLGRYKASEMTMQEVVQAYPELGQLLYDVVVNKLPFNVAVARNIDIDGIRPQEGDEDFDAWQAAYTERVDKAKKYADTEKEIEANQQASIALVDEFAAEKGLTDEQKNTLLDSIEKSFQDMLYKKLSRELLDAHYKAMVFDDEVKAAEQAGEIKAKNESIDQLKIKENRSQEGDGIPRSAGKGGVVETKQKRTNILFDGIKERKGI